MTDDDPDRRGAVLAAVCAALDGPARTWDEAISAAVTAGAGATPPVTEAEAAEQMGRLLAAVQSLPAIKCARHGPMTRDDTACWWRCGACGRTLPDEEYLRLIGGCPEPPARDHPHLSGRRGERDR